MTMTGPGAIDRVYLDRFFRDHEVDVFAAVLPSSLMPPLVERRRTSCRNAGP